MKEQAWILDNQLEKTALQNWLRAGGPDEQGRRGLSVLKTQKYINDILLKDHELGRVNKRTGNPTPSLSHTH